MKIEIARVKRNGAENRMQMAREFSKADAFKLVRMSDVIATLRVYERDGLLKVTDTELIMYHIV